MTLKHNIYITLAFHSFVVPNGFKRVSIYLALVLANTIFNFFELQTFCVSSKNDINLNKHRMVLS